jgi:S1-C subfamily serine protease
MSLERSAAIKMGLAALVAIGAVAGGVKYSRTHTRPIEPRAGSSSDIRTVLPSRVAVPRPAASGFPTPATPGTPADRAGSPGSAPRSLEDVIARAMPAVVLVETDTGRGSGFFVTPDVVATNAHVVAEFARVAVTTQSGATLDGRVATKSTDFDVALIQLAAPARAEAQLPLGDSAALRLGQAVIALGWAQSLTQSPLTRGVVTGLRRDGRRQLVQTDAVPNRGDSGGPLLNASGEVVGIMTFRVDDREHGAAAGFALAINDVKPFVGGIAHEIAHDLAAAAPIAPDPAGSALDARRAAADTRYASTLAAIAERADAVDAAWKQYTIACGITAVPGGEPREWFHLYDPRSPLHHTAASCARPLDDLERQAAAIKTALTAAEEAAREGDVYPGTRRALRQRYRLDYTGWDR